MSESLVLNVYWQYGLIKSRIFPTMKESLTLTGSIAAIVGPVIGITTLILLIYWRKPPLKIKVFGEPIKEEKTGFYQVSVRIKGRFGRLPNYQYIAFDLLGGQRIEILENAPGYPFTFFRKTNPSNNSIQYDFKESAIKAEVRRRQGTLTGTFSAYTIDDRVQTVKIPKAVMKALSG